MNKIIVLYGPTAVGKSKIAVELAKMINGEIISADSMQIYKNLDIGTAKILPNEMDGIEHHLINIIEPNDEYTVANFCEDAINIINNIFAKGKIPIVVGGTGLYIKALTEGYDFGNTVKNVELRQSFETMSNAELKEELLKVCPQIDIDFDNRKRVVRALEIANNGQIKNKKISIYDFVVFGICDDRQKIYERINCRVDLMVKEGLLNEAKYLINLNLSETNQCIKAIGYKELFPYLRGEDTLDNCINILKQKTRNYAKRQITFYNQFKNIKFVNYCGQKETAKNILNILRGNNE